MINFCIYDIDFFHMVLSLEPLRTTYSEVQSLVFHMVCACGYWYERHHIFAYAFPKVSNLSIISSCVIICFWVVVVVVFFWKGRGFQIVDPAPRQKGGSNPHLLEPAAILMRKRGQCIKLRPFSFEHHSPANSSTPLISSLNPTLLT